MCDLFIYHIEISVIWRSIWSICSLSGHSNFNRPPHSRILTLTLYAPLFLTLNLITFFNLPSYHNFISNIVLTYLQIRIEYIELTIMFSYAQVRVWDASICRCELNIMLNITEQKPDMLFLGCLLQVLGNKSEEYELRYSS